MISYVDVPLRPRPFPNRRARLIDFAALLGNGHPYRTFDLKLGPKRLEWTDLTNEALERIALDMVHDFWRFRRMQRENRAGHARWLAEQAGKQHA